MFKKYVIVSTFCFLRGDSKGRDELKSHASRISGDTIKDDAKK